MWALEVLSSLSYRDGELSQYLKDIACGVSKLIGIDWSVVTLCQNGFSKVLASSLESVDYNSTYSTHGFLSGTVVETGQVILVEDTKTCTKYGRGPEGYRAYLGVPLRTSQGKNIGTVCLFHQEPRNFSVEEIDIVKLFAERAATAIDNYHLYQAQQQFNQILETELAQRTKELQSAQAKLIEQERLAAIGEFAACIIHEIRNPVTTMKMGLNYFKKIDLLDAAKIRLSLALDEADRLEKLLQEILLYAKPQILEPTQVDLDKFFTKISVHLQSMPEAEGKYLKFISTAITTKVLGDEDKLKQVLINTVRNAFEAINVGDTVNLSLENDFDGTQVWIHIHNNGELIPPEILSRLTQPFYSTKSSGTGLGLAISKRIVEAHNGELLIQSNFQGTTVSVKLPVVDE